MPTLTPLAPPQCNQKWQSHVPCLGVMVLSANYTLPYMWHLVQRCVKGKWRASGRSQERFGFFWSNSGAPRSHQAPVLLLSWQNWAHHTSNRFAATKMESTSQANVSPLGGPRKTTTQVCQRTFVTALRYIFDLL